LRAREDDRARGDDRPVSDLGGLERITFCGRARREGGLLPDDRVLEHLDPVSQHRAGIDNRRGVNFRAHPCRLSVSSSSARTTSSPSCISRPSHPSCTSRTKCWHSSLSGSAFETFGLKVSPVRVVHSPYESGGCFRALS